MPHQAQNLPLRLIDKHNRKDCFFQCCSRRVPDRAGRRDPTDNAYDTDERVLRSLEGAGRSHVIPPRINRKIKRPYDRDLNKARHLIEDFFAKLKQFRAIATRYDKTARNFLAGVHLASSPVWLN